MDTLGEVLRKRRKELGLSLRGAEDNAGVSNAYLSQLENGKIRQPSPSVLEKLSSLYKLSYPRLMRLAGHPPVRHEDQKTVFFRTSSGLEEISEEEEKELLEYLRFLRLRRSE